TAREKDAREAQQKLSEKADELQLQVYKVKVALAQQECQQVSFPTASRLLHECPPPLRGWEWHYVNRLGHLQLQRFQYNARVYGVALAPDGGRLVVATTKELFWYETAGGKLVGPRGPAVPLTPWTLWSRRRPLAFSPDGTLLACLSARNTILLLDARNLGRE